MGLIPGQAFNLVFAVHNLSTENEYIKHIKFDFPPGVVISGATNFSGGSLGELTFQGTPGNGASLNWHGESIGGRGVLKPGETALATVTGTVSESFMNDVFVVYQLRGDSIGAAPHSNYGYVKIRNFGLANTWVTLTNPSGTLMSNQTGTVAVNIKAANLVPDTYQCNLVARDLYNNKFVIPLTLHVTFPVEIGNPKLFTITSLRGNSPNPFSGVTQIRYDISSSRDVTIELYTLQGLMFRSWKYVAMQPGVHAQQWDGTDGIGNQVPAGVYTCRLKAGDYTGSLKMILIR